MQRLTLNTIPKWLEHSALATSLREGKTMHDGDENDPDTEEDAFEVPREYYMSDGDVLHIATTEQLEYMLQTMHYWGEYERVPWSVLDVVREKRLPLDGLNNTKWVHEPTMKTIVMVMEWICGYEISTWTWKTDCLAKLGSIYILQYVHEHGCTWNEHTCAYAAENGHLECLRYLHENSCPWDVMTCNKAAENGHLECLRYAHENGCPWNEWTCAMAAFNGHLECLRYAHENGCPWDTDTCSRAALIGHLECLRYAHENDCPWDIATCACAVPDEILQSICNNQLKCLQYAIEHGCPHSPRHLVHLRPILVIEGDITDLIKDLIK